MSMGGWDEQLSETLIHYALKSPTDDRDWKQIASAVPGKTAEECERWWEFLVSVDSILQEHGLSKSPQAPRTRSSTPLSDSNNSLDDSSKKRQRRPAILIDRKYKCPAPDCPRAYGTEGALKFHIKSKHKDNNYSPPRTKSGSSSNSNNDNSVPSPANVPTIQSPMLIPPRFFPNGLGLSAPLFPPNMDFTNASGLQLPENLTAQNQFFNPNMLRVMINSPMYDPDKQIDPKMGYPSEISVPEDYLPLDPRLILGTFPEYNPPHTKQKL